MPKKKSVKQTKKQTKRKAPKTAWPKGVSGNPNGRPTKENSFVTLIEERIEQKLPASFISLIPEKKDRARFRNKTYKEALLMVLLEESIIHRNSRATTELLDRWMGKAPLPIKADNSSFIINAYPPSED